MKDPGGLMGLSIGGRPGVSGMVCTGDWLTRSSCVGPVSYGGAVAEHFLFTCLNLIVRYMIF